MSLIAWTLGSTSTHVNARSLAATRAHPGRWTGRRPRGSGDPEPHDRTYLVARDGQGVDAPHIVNATSPSCGHRSVSSCGVADDDRPSTRNRERLCDGGPLREAADAQLE